MSTTHPSTVVDGRSQVTLNSLGLDTTALQSPGEVPTHGNPDLWFLPWHSKPEARLFSLQVDSRDRLLEKAGFDLFRRSRWPQDVVWSGGRPVGHTLASRRDPLSLPQQSDLQDSIHAWNWVCNIMQAAHSSGWTVGGLQSGLLMNPTGLPVQWAKTEQARPWQAYAGPQQYRNARAEERNELARLLMSQLGTTDLTLGSQSSLELGAVWTPHAGVDDSVALKLSLLWQRLGVDSRHPPTAREWQIGLSGVKLVKTLALKHRNRPWSNVPADLVMIVLNPDPLASGDWASTWATLVAGIRRNSRMARVAVLAGDESLTEILPLADPNPTSPPHVWKSSEAPEAHHLHTYLKQRAFQNYELLTADGLNVAALHLLFPSESSGLGPEQEWLQGLEANLGCPVGLHLYDRHGNFVDRRPGSSFPGSATSPGRPDESINTSAAIPPAAIPLHTHTPPFAAPALQPAESPRGDPSALDPSRPFAPAPSNAYFPTPPQGREPSNLNTRNRRIMMIVIVSILAALVLAAALFVATRFAGVIDVSRASLSIGLNPPSYAP